MFGNWPGRAVQDLQDAGLLLVEDGNHGENRPLQHEFVSMGRPFVRPDDLKFGHVAFDQCDQINEDAVRRVRKGHGRARDVLFTHRATVGRMALVEDGAPDFVANPGVTLWRSLDSTVLNYRFLYYWMHCQAFMRQVWAVAGSTDTFPYVSLTEQRRLLVAIPPIEEQRAIASILGALDDKIDLNRRMNATLEAMARAIFKDWFVDFGPTRAKIEGRAPYLAPDIWSLFPDRLDDEGKPEGWAIGTLLDLCQLKRGYDLPAARRVPGRIPIVSSSGITDHHDRAMAEGPGVVTGRYGTIGEVFFIEEPYWPLNTALYVKNFRGNSRRFVFYVLRLLDFQQYSDKGAVPGVNRNDLHRAPIVIPAPEVQQAFEAILSPGWERIAANQAEAETLAQTRDLLLPKLMSGELRVPAAERLVETAL